MRIVVKQATNGAWFWHLKARNGRILATSETYSSRSKAVKVARRVALLGYCNGFKVVVEGAA